MTRPRLRLRPALIALASIATQAASTADASGPKAATASLAGIDLPADWRAKYWSEAGPKALAALPPRAIADLVPVQAGLRHCRCPTCAGGEGEEALDWSGDKPAVVTCRRCGGAFPNDKFPAKKDDKVPSDEVEVLPKVVHKYPYHALADDEQRFPDERLYLAAKRDYEAREGLAKFALYAAVAHRDRPDRWGDPALARSAAVVILRFAQVYPAYAVHYDQPRQPKFFQSADTPPPYRRDYKSAKWDWSGCLDVPLNLVLAYAILRDDPAIAEAGRLLGDPHPARTIERDLFRASAEFVRRQPDERTESSLYAYRGLLAVANLLGDDRARAETLARIEEFSHRGFYHDGLWREGDLRSHRHVLDQFDGWLARMMPGAAGAAALPALAQARDAERSLMASPVDPGIVRAAWPPVPLRASANRPAFLGGAGVARLSVGEGRNSLDLEVRGLGDLGGAMHTNRLALRVGVGGRPILGDLDDLPETDDGVDLATSSHNVVVVDGLNQRESPERSRVPAPGSDILFYAADPDFQVATMDDRFAYPASTTRYRQTVVACAGVRSRYAVSVFEVWGGLQHDQLYHGAPGVGGRWAIPTPTTPGPPTLLPPSITFVPDTRAADGRWFVQSIGAIRGLAQAAVSRPTTAFLKGPGADGLLMHILDDYPKRIVTGRSPDPAAPTDEEESDRASLILRRRSEDGASLRSTFVTVFEPIGAGPRLRRVGRVASAADLVTIVVETAEGVEHLVVNLAAGSPRSTRLSDNRVLTTDGLAVRETPRGLTLAGGTHAETPGRGVASTRASGAIVGGGIERSRAHRGWFDVDGPLDDLPALAGRALLIQHGDGVTRGWTIDRAEPRTPGSTRLYVREEPGFLLDPASNVAHYYQFPGQDAPGPHRYRVAKISR